MRTTSNTKTDTTAEIKCAMPWRLTKVKPLKNYSLEVEFLDGTHGCVEMKSLIMSQSAGVFSNLIDINIFNKVYLEFGVATWPGNIDLAPDAMYNEIKKHGVWKL